VKNTFPNIYFDMKRAKIFIM